jgi:hypothetical protein
VETSQLVDAAEGQRITGLSRATLYKLAGSGRVRSFKVLNTLRFERGDLLALVRPRAIGRKG